MPTFNDPTADADELREAARGLAHATRSMNNSTAVYPVLGALTASLASMSQSLHQLGDLHDQPAKCGVSAIGDAQAGRAASYRVAWELHRAAEMLQQVAECIDRAHEIEASMTYATSTPERPHRHPAPNAGLSL
ncbi:hypothetical protein EXE58_19010 [Nocardioides seonyuensis]|uniref:ESX-1 secretion-associated protein n=1 Tax=Nocardioides seonyuensis TaxID=2518371 RepID=A0A4P7IIW1_9ACTN|nr:hypothetical protein [Nocardioides seonyuensis]QBX57308.1 hypothetical protein EXE58_19010 [Nocardioides seonyuensis]